MSVRSAVTRALLGLALATLASCAGMPGHSACAFFSGDAACGRLPISADSGGTEIAAAGYFASDGNSAYEREFQALLAQSRLDALDRANGTGRFGRDWRDVQNSGFHAAYPALQQLVKPLDKTEVAPVQGQPGEGHFTGRWRMSRQTLYLDAAARPSAPKTFSFSGLQARSVQIVLRQAGQQPVDIGGSCDGPLAIRASGRSTTVARASPFHLSLPVADTSSVSLFPDETLSRCDLRISSSQAPAGAPLTLLREEAADPWIAGLDSRYDRCPVPDPAGLEELDRVFYASRWLSQTCALPLGSPTLLRKSREGFNAKVEALLGKTLPDSALDKADPELPLDFSNAPKLRLIYLSSLEFKADFSGRVMERLIRHHAALGTKVRILVTDVLEREKDDAMLHRLASEFPNVELQEYRWQADQGAPFDEQISQLHKTHHVKMLATLAEEPGRSRVIIGGRNIHDGFLFHRPVDLTRYPDLQQYGKTDGFSLNYYSNWSDFDIEIADQTTVETLAAHLSTIWLRDANTNLSRPFSIPVRSGGSPRCVARHFISVPYEDGHALEAYFVELIDTAEHRIEIVNPYLNLTPDIASAFDRALARGVKIDVVGRIDLKGDIGGRFLTALNKLFVERYGDRINIREFKAPDVVLHSKIMMIDERLVAISSVNLNNRSFFHDSENGFVVLDSAFYRRMKPVYDDYLAHSRPVSANVTIGWAYRLLFSDKSVREAF
ncbi:phosphatidylserine/phosphatidylglycerophosphate/cardiolipin synthase family protein [Mesorhizobium sp. M2D.F.Ca.ET.185.01.1.1]|uniref:phospholipase D-like domain-containing protein n=1 Tax=unclassified Mesorhizobium TaxID=325217 RepID=UPI000FCBCF00|nr:MULTISPECIES: phosphatidylserine/phosphatidylglycerophosphate/cardiolipin synthase family protein [unclassified Mesorhizobium]TGP83533.1 phosphatidylserine/phosphatidylglycerophosphate/cardiolipin synthase family protein [bacterium M00.F.Ca.ET.227.01.1.1]TGP99488.1 phosphatidylserine/phosphatidylglycerophosphate/cardiolipin synthase family protein [bacterium M00.F.Ca.ET.221.01.1.1]TGQ00217.1 phosphatidylserine/phosphatidylglycerophosphate/cardiolipin synthase family protein [bacterium M00.F.C